MRFLRGSNHYIGSVWCLKCGFIFEPMVIEKTLLEFKLVIYIGSYFNDRLQTSNHVNKIYSITKAELTNRKPIPSFPNKIQQ